MTFSRKDINKANKKLWSNKGWMEPVKKNQPSLGTMLQKKQKKYEKRF
jgi:hypothetical protein